MNEEVVIDYAYPMMMAEKALKDAHNCLLSKKFDEALEQLLVAVTETRITINSVKHMKEQYDALCKQTQTV
jgi:hypothetical protein